MDAVSGFGRGRFIAFGGDDCVGPNSNEIERGRVFAEKNCSTCHAIGHTGSSPYAQAPPFRTLHERYDVEALAEALAEGMIVGDTGDRQMPVFRLEPQQIDDLLAYLKSLEVPTSLGRGQDRS